MRRDSDHIRIIKELQSDPIALYIYIAAVTKIIGSLINATPFAVASKNCGRLATTKTNPCEAHTIRALSYR